MGEGQVGKTSIVKALAGEPHNPGEPTTHGMRIRDLSLKHPEHAGVDMSLSFWDFGGQDIYHATHQFFLTDRSLFLLVWSPRLGHDHSRVRYWLDIITARAPTARILLIATHCATLRPDLPLQEICRTYPRIVGSFAVDCDPRTGIDELRRAVADEASQLPLMGLPWPLAWSETTKWLQSAAEPYIPTEQLKSMMASAGVTEPVEQGELALVLTHLGEILYYPDDENLADMVVTQPDWLNAHISQVLESTGLVARQGLLTREVIDRDPGVVLCLLSVVCCPLPAVHCPTCPRAQGRTRMTVLPLRRSAGLSAGTASSRVATVPMCGRRRPSRTRSTICVS